MAWFAWCDVRPRLILCANRGAVVCCRRLAVKRRRRLLRAIDTADPAVRWVIATPAAWGPAKQIAAEPAARGIDLSDSEAVEEAARGLNAERPQGRAGRMLGRMAL
jgi:hypothetical protein